MRHDRFIAPLRCSFGGEKGWAETYPAIVVRKMDGIESYSRDKSRDIVKMSAKSIEAASSKSETKYIYVKDVAPRDLKRSTGIQGWTFSIRALSFESDGFLLSQCHPLGFGYAWEHPRPREMSLSTNTMSGTVVGVRFTSHSKLGKYRFDCSCGELPTTLDLINYTTARPSIGRSCILS